MFEKEAEEYVDEEYDFCYYPEDNLSTRINAKRDWQQGAEFGYNKYNERLTKAKGLLKWFVWYFKEGSPNLVPYKHKVKEAEQFLRESE